ncbi:hypothetical protein [Luteitalea pratensis]|nr:hypothetical protein [Luteitalea pratensis]
MSKALELDIPAFSAFRHQVASAAMSKALELDIPAFSPFRH